MTCKLLFRLGSLMLILGSVLSRPSDVTNYESQPWEYFGQDYDVAARVASWTPQDEGNPWELSGLFEGDIMVEPDMPQARNVLINSHSVWDEATIPYILHPDFNDGERRIIKEGMNMIEQQSCVKFRPFMLGDTDFVLVTGNPTGCWSYVGRLGGGQELNLQRYGCVWPSVVAHEFLHAAGFFHQQSASNRDKYVFVNYTNILPGRESNFAKHSESTVTDFGVEYDYKSIMHYSRKACSKNGEDTIVPLEEGITELGGGLVTEKDFEKLRLKYNCKTIKSDNPVSQN